tara:strand:+ start:10679 stop:11257 length:579 start_codon:yes stop_codon:yes gene_type:complete
LENTKQKLDTKKLIKRLRQGKAEAYNYLFSEYYDWLCNYIFSLCEDRSLAEDIVQDTMTKLWEGRKKIHITSSLKNYIFKSCHNQFLQHIRKQKIQFDSLDQMRWDVIAEKTLEHENYDYKINKLNKLINQLPPRCKEIFVKNKLENKKYREIAIDMNISIKTVEKQMSKALLFLRKNACSFIFIMYLTNIV